MPVIQLLLFDRLYYFMTIERVTYQKIFLLGATFINEKVGMEVILNPGDTPEAALSEAKKIVEDWHMATNPQLYTGGVRTIPLDENLPEIRKEPLEVDLQTEKEISELKVNLENCNTYDQAFEMLQSSNFKYHIELKQVVLSKSKS